jgi:hypothetical protein
MARVALTVFRSLHVTPSAEEETVGTGAVPDPTEYPTISRRSAFAVGVKVAVV